MGYEKYALNLFAFIIACIIYIDGTKIQNKFFSHRIFMHILKSALVLLVVDVLACVFDGLPGQLYYLLNVSMNGLLYILTIVPVILWVIYADYQVFHDHNRVKNICFIGSALFLLNAFLTITSLYHGLYFYVDSNNIYHRGEYFWFHILLCYGTMLYTFVFVLCNHRNIERSYYKSILLYSVPQMIGSILQVAFFGILLNWSFMVISILFVYLNIQNIRLRTDYLTGAFNRMALDRYLLDRIKWNGIKYGGFSGILLDIDNFKYINDTYGHAAGDGALKDTVTILRAALGNTEFISRYGGDEFFLVLDVDDQKALLESIEKINDAKDAFNFRKETQYDIQFSMGYAIYGEIPQKGPDAFTKHVDCLMYADKQMKSKIIRLIM